MPISKVTSGIKTAGDVMTTRLATVSHRTDVATAIGLLAKHNISGMPVLDDHGNYAGVFSEKSSLRALVQTAATLHESGEPLHAGDFMVQRLVCLSPQTDVFDAIGTLLANRFSGAPVVDPDGRPLGVFSEKDSMRVLIKGAYEQWPGAEVGAFMNPDPGRIITEQTDLPTIADMFVNTPYRRLLVVRQDILQGQISRRDVLHHSRLLASILRNMISMADEQGVPAPSARSEAARDQLASTCVARFMDTQARTIRDDVDLLTIAQIFLTTPYRRLPVVRDGHLLGQISRRDVLAAVYQLIEPVAGDRQESLLYLSAVLRDGDPIPLLQ